MEAVQWGDDERQRYSFRRGHGAGPWLVVIHGGAWRAPVVTDASGHHLIDCVRAQHADKYAGYASLDYRLSPEVVHPAHLDDALQGLADLARRCGVSRVVLAGHSCGVFIAGQLAGLLAESAAAAAATDQSAAETAGGGTKLKQQVPSVTVEEIVCLEGIYDLPELIAEYPDYTGFVRDAFPNELPRIDWKHLRPSIKVIHSEQDELLTLRQPQWLAAQRQVSFNVIPHGLHDEVFEQVDLAQFF